MKRGALVNLKAAWPAKVVASKAVGALYLHCAGAHGALWGLCESLHLQ
jgi:hypothetical protein